MLIGRGRRRMATMPRLHAVAIQVSNEGESATRFDLSGAATALLGWPSGAA
jgi:hypothetical protein